MPLESMQNGSPVGTACKVVGLGVEVEAVVAVVMRVELILIDGRSDTLGFTDSRTLDGDRGAVMW
jgi:hypothetical protein